MLYNPKTFFTHAALLDQASAHCPIFPTAASRRSLGRVSVPMWLIILSDQLTIVALVGHYPANKLIVRRLLSRRIAALALGRHAVLAVVSHSCPPPGDRYLRVTHPSATDRSYPQSVRLACVKHAASVRSEPGSNSQVHQRSALSDQTKTNKPCLNQQTFCPRCGAPENKPHKRNCNASRIRDSHAHKSIKTRENRAHSQAPSPTDLNAQTILPVQERHKGAANVSLP